MLNCLKYIVIKTVSEGFKLGIKFWFYSQVTGQHLLVPEESL